MPAISHFVLGLLPWAAWYAVIELWKASVLRAVDPAGYSGTCYKASGYAVNCTLEQWQLWDAMPLINVFTFVGGLGAAALSGLVYLRYLASATGNASGAGKPAPMD